MTLAEQIADDITKQVASKYLYFSNPQKDEIRRLITAKIAAYVPEPQQQLGFDDAKVNADQADAILKLLKERRSAGATNAELAKLALKYTGRCSDLRKQGYRIFCKRESGRAFRYMLSPEMW